MVSQVGGRVEQHGLEIDRLRERLRAFAPPKVSPLWWLLPPVKIILERISLYQYRNKLLEALSREEFEALLDFTNKGTGWLFVAGGGFLLPVNETWEVAERWQLGPWWYAGLCALCVGLCVLNTSLRVSSTNRRLVKKKQFDAAKAA
jgi:hypothetical protein